MNELPPVLRVGRQTLTTVLGRTARNSKPLEVIGVYDPVPKPDPYDKSGKMHKDIQLDLVRARYWIGVGAQPSDPAWRLLSMVIHQCLRH
jgi:ribosomal protein S16